MSTDALVFLARREYTNAVTRRLRRLREPRYLVALVAAVAYLVLLLPRNGAGTPATLVDPTLPVEPLLVLAASALLLWGWLFADRRTPLEFTPAELTWLFPAPLPRRTLILYKLARWQLPLLFNALLLTLLFSADRAPGFAVRRVLALWVLLATLRLHRLAASLVRSRWFEPDAGGAWRSPATLPALLWVSVLLAAAASAVEAPSISAAIRAFAEHPLARAALWPISMVVHPVFAAPAPLRWFSAFGPALLLLAAHVLWVVRADAAFGAAASRAAASGEISELDVREARRVRPAAGRILVALPPLGDPLLAILWKQLAPFLRRDRVWRGLIGVALALSAALVIGQAQVGELASLLVAAGIVVTGALAVAGPQLVRVDLRRELGRWELLRALPLSGERVLAGLAAATVVVVTALQVAGLLFLAALGAVREMELDGGTVGWAARALLVLPPLNALGSVVALAGAVLFPAWSAPLMRRGGLDALGTNLVALAAYLAGVAGLVLPAAALAGLVAGPELLAAPAPRLAAAAGAAWGVVALECVLLLRWLGERFAATDRAATGLS